jgi:peptide deformylase
MAYEKIMKIITTQKKENEKFLRTPVPDIDLQNEDSKELRKIIKEMRLAMYSSHGVGLSANQVGISKRLFIAHLPETVEKPQKFYAILNPSIIKISDEMESQEEGCLSIPNTLGVVERAKDITLAGYAVHGKKVVIKARGLLARVFQHELDHLDGILFIDKAKLLDNPILD